MHPASAGCEAVSTKTRKGRPGTGRPPAILHDTNIIDYSPGAYQAQRLIELYGLRTERAQLVAALFFGGCHG